MRFDVEEKILILWSGVFRSVGSRHTEHHCKRPVTQQNKPIQHYLHYVATLPCDGVFSCVTTIHLCSTTNDGLVVRLMSKKSWVLFPVEPL